jgi:hypothetical protein
MCVHQGQPTILATVDKLNVRYKCKLNALCRECKMHSRLSKVLFPIPSKCAVLVSALLYLVCVPIRVVTATGHDGLASHGWDPLVHR